MSEDRVLLRGLSFHGFHGVAPEENRVGQRFLVDVDLHMDLAHAAHTDDLTKTVDYAAVLADVRQIVEGPPLKLVETVAERIAARILLHYPVDSVRVRVKKPDAPVAAAFEYLGVEIVRRRAQ